MKDLVLKRSLAGILLAGCLELTALGCERVLAPQRSTIGDLRRHATSGVGQFVGSVREWQAPLPCARSTRVVPGARVDVGLWDGSPAFYRDTVTHQPPASANDPRFQLLASTTTDADGRFRFDNMPRRVAYAMRVIPPKGASWDVSYGETMYGVPTGGDLEEFPTLCVSLR